MGRMSLRREMLFSGPIRDLPTGSKSSRDLWIVSNSSRAASRRSIRRLIVSGFLLRRGTAPGRLRFLGPKVGTLTAINGIYFWGGVLLFAIAGTEHLFHKQFFPEHLARLISTETNHQVAAPLRRGFLEQVPTVRGLQGRQV